MRMTMVACLALLATSTTQIQAAMIVDTGGSPGGVNWGFMPSQYFAGEFSVGSDYEITRVEGFFRNNTGSSASVDVALHAGGGNAPGSLLYAATVAIAPGAPYGWYGASNLNWLVTAGTYWVSFRPDFIGAMPGGATSPLANYSQASGNYVWGPDIYDDVNVGIRIDATAVSDVPAPASLILWGMGGGLAFVGRKLRRGRKAANQAA